LFKKLTKIISVVIFLLLGTDNACWSNDFEKALTAYGAGDYKTAFEVWEFLAEQGHAPSQYNLGQMYRRALGVPQDLKAARKWYKLAAKQGNANAQHNLGVMISTGNAETQDLVASFKWFQLAAQQGYVPSQYNLGHAYAKGKGIPKNYVYAHMWWNIAALNGNKNAAANRDLLEKYLTPDDFTSAKELARECVHKRLKGCAKQSDFVLLTTRNIYEGMYVFKNPNWNKAWGDKEIHPPTKNFGTVRSWSDMNGNLYGRYHGDKNQLRWPGLVCVDWHGAGFGTWKSRQAYRIGFAEEYWLVGDNAK